MSHREDRDGKKEEKKRMSAENVTAGSPARWVRIALAQMGNAGSMEKNLEKSVDLIWSAAAEGADLVLFPEVQLTEFFPQYPGGDARACALTLESEPVRALQSACRENHVMAVPNIYLQQDGQYYDASLLIGREGELLGLQKMVHIAQAPQFYEQDYYTPADDGFHVFPTDIGNIGIVVCFDRHYPESIRTEALRGADLILVPTVNTKAEPLETFAWEMRIQAFQSCVAVAMCNRVGAEGEMDFAGESLVCDAQGQLIVLADDQERLVLADVNLAAVRQVREQKPYTSLRRPQLYE